MVLEWIEHDPKKTNKHYDNASRMFLRLSWQCSASKVFANSHTDNFFAICMHKNITLKRKAAAGISFNSYLQKHRHLKGLLLDLTAPYYVIVWRLLLNDYKQRIINSNKLNAQTLLRWGPIVTKLVTTYGWKWLPIY